MPSSELLLSVVVTVPGAGTTTPGSVVVVVVFDIVVCATAVPDMRNKAQAAADKCFSIVMLHDFG
jgi:hypothetical protein